MTKLKMQVKTTYHVNYSDLERFIQDVYNVDEFSIPCDQEKGNDTSLEMNVEKRILDKYEIIRLEEFKKDPDNETYMLYTLMDDMCSRGLIPDGLYIIRISW